MCTQGGPWFTPEAAADSGLDDSTTVLFSFDI